MNSETRKPMAETGPNTESRMVIMRPGVESCVSGFGIASAIGVRPSAFLPLSWN